MRLNIFACKNISKRVGSLSKHLHSAARHYKRTAILWSIMLKNAKSSIQKGQAVLGIFQKIENDNVISVICSRSRRIPTKCHIHPIHLDH